MSGPRWVQDSADGRPRWDLKAGLSELQLGRSPPLLAARPPGSVWKLAASTLCAPAAGSVAPKVRVPPTGTLPRVITEWSTSA